MKIYTKTGDKGETSLLGGERVSKHHDQIEAYGTVDELNACLGLVAVTNEHKTLDAMIPSIQRNLFNAGSELAQSEKYKPKKQSAHFQPITTEAVETLETWIDQLEEDLPPLKNFILPGGTPAAAHLHLARCICRRAERRVIALAHQRDVRTELITYLNRLSDLLFVMARAANHLSGREDIPW